VDKRRWRLREGVESLVAIDPARVGFLTLTFADDPSPKEASRRWRRLRRALARIAYGGIRVSERTKAGRIHYHVVLLLRHPIRQGYDFEAVRRGDYRSAPRNLRAYWRWLRLVLPRFGFGRHQLEPVKCPERAGWYVAKYLSKDSERHPDDRGKHLVEAWGVGAECMPSARFSWAFGGARAFRAVCAEIARWFGQRYEGWGNVIRLQWGPKWAWRVILVMRGSPLLVEESIHRLEGG